MADGPRFGLTGFPLGHMGASLDAPPAQVVTELSRAADRLGFDFVAAQDHVVAPREWLERGTGKTWFDPFVVLSWAAASTQRVRLLTDVVVLPYRSPFVVAKAGASLDALSGGRLVLGVAAGYLEREFHILHAEFEDRGDWTDEAIQAIQACWEHEWVDFSGDYFNAHDVAVSPRPVQQPRPPIWIGGNSMRALRRAVEFADGWTPFRGDADVIREALARARGSFGLDRPFDVAAPLRRGVYREDDRTLDVDSILKTVDGLAEAGVTHVKVGFRGPGIEDYVRAMEAFAEAVLPRYT